MDPIAGRAAAKIPPEATALVLAGSDGDDNPVLVHLSQVERDEWIPVSYSILSFGGAGAPEILSMEPETGGDDIVITGPRFTYDLGGGGGTGGGTTTGGGGNGGGGDGGGGSSGGSGATGVEPHEQDCGTEDGAAVQIANHVKGTLPAGSSGPEDRVMTSTGKDWTQVEFGAVIVRNPDGSFGPLNDMIYSSDLSGFLVYPNIAGQPVQGLWHSHDQTGDTQRDRLVSRYPSSDDWHWLSIVAGIPGAASNPSLWIMDSFGTTREFKFSERAYFLSLFADEARMVNGEGLEGRERTQSCE